MTEMEQTTDAETYVCLVCEGVADDPTCSDTRWSNVKNGWVCWPCYESEQQYSSTVWFVDGDGVRKYYVNDVEIMDEYGDTDAEEVGLLSRSWVRTDAWRGYFQTNIEDWIEIESGWTTGGWGDPISDRKQSINQWIEEILNGTIVTDIPLAIVADPTSNVFSTGIGVFVPVEYGKDAWQRITNGDAERLSQSLG